MLPPLLCCRITCADYITERGNGQGLCAAIGERVYLEFLNDMSRESVMPNGALWNAVEQRAVRHLCGPPGEILRRGGMLNHSSKATQRIETHPGEFHQGPAYLRINGR